MQRIYKLIREKRGIAAALLLLAPFAAFALLSGVRAVYMTYIARYIPPCWMRMLTGLRCPACGMTHSVTALTHFQIAQAARENLMIPVFALLPLLWYAELWTVWAGHHRRLLPRQGAFWTGLLLFWGIYAVVRNLI